MLDTTKSSGVDGIGPKILKLCGDHIVLPITAIINNSISKGIFPELLKEAFVIPIYKNSGRENPTTIDQSQYCQLYLKSLKNT